MHNQRIDELEDQFNEHPHIDFSRTDSGLVMAHIENNHCIADLCLQGAHLCRFALKSNHEINEVLWLSTVANYQVGKAIRGGIPICWPWFGNHPSDPNLPAHGFARTSNWQLRDCIANDDGSTELILSLTSTVETLRLWPHEFTLELRVTLGEQLKLALTTHNTGSKPLTLSSALHTYFGVKDIAQTVVNGLDGARYFDKNSNDFANQCGPLVITKATDHVYQNTIASCELIDQAADRILTISKEHSETTVIWNPWQDAAHNMQDFDDQGYKQMICIEAANFDLDAVHLAPGNSHTLVQQVSLNVINR